MRSASGLSEELPYSPEECDRPYDNAGKALKILWRWKTKNRVRAHSITCRKTLAMLQNASELTGNATTHLRQSKLLISFVLAQLSIAKFAVRRLYAAEECNDSLMASGTAISMNIATGSRILHKVMPLASANGPVLACLKFGLQFALSRSGGTLSESAEEQYRRQVMTVLLVLVTFAIFLTIDFFYSNAKHPKPRVAPALRKAEGATPQLPSLVGGFAVPDNRRYHPGHTWALSESPNLVRVGLDDFASKLTSKIERITLPQRGQWIRQGQKVWSLVCNGTKVDMVSPIEGSVADVNETVVNDPGLATRDPYNEGWMITVQSPDAKTNFRNLLGGALARWWTEESAMRLQRVMPGALAALAQDGGVAMNDIASQLPHEQWAKITREFFLT